MATPKRFADAPQLQKFTLEDVTPTGKQLGVGSFGSVEELRVAGAVCAGKKVHATLLDPGNHGWQKMVERFQAECELMSELRHPNLVQFLGLYFYQDGTGPVLVMERLERSLHNFMEEYKRKKIPLALKTHILFDVAKGLVHLHTRNPVVVHRDLTARNVLLTSSMQAKIADLGNARIINPVQLSSTLSQTPGTTVYMPPEATGGSPNYDTKLDMFSFGHLSLYVVAQEFPENLLPSTYTDPVSETLLPRSEIQRRQPVIDKMRIHKKHTLSVIITECLDNIPKKRPDAHSVMRQLEGLVESDGDSKGMSRTELLRMIVERESLTRSKVNLIRGGKPEALQFLKISRWRKPAWKPYAFQIKDSQLQLLGAQKTIRESVRLQDIQEVTPCSQHSSQGTAAFEIKIYGKSSWTLAAFSEEDRACWMEALFLPELTSKRGGSNSSFEDESPYIEMTGQEASSNEKLNLYECVPEDLYEQPFYPDDPQQDEEGYAILPELGTEPYEEPQSLHRNGVHHLAPPQGANNPKSKSRDIPTDDNIAYNIPEAKPRKSPRMKPKLLGPPLPTAKPSEVKGDDPIEEDTYNRLSNSFPKQVSIKRPLPGDQQQKAKLYVDPNQIEMLIGMLHAAEPSIAICDESEHPHSLPRQRSYTVPQNAFVPADDDVPEDEHEMDREDNDGKEEDDNGDPPPLYDTIIDSDMESTGDDTAAAGGDTLEDTEDFNVHSLLEDTADREEMFEQRQQWAKAKAAPTLGDTGVIEIYDDALPSFSKKDVYVNMDELAQLQQAIEKSEAAPPPKKPVVPPKPPKRRYVNLPDKVAPPVLPPRPEGKKPKPKPAQPKPPLSNDKPQRNENPSLRPNPNTSAARHFTMVGGDPRTARRRRQTNQDDWIKRIAKQVKLKSEKFLLEDIEDDEEMYEPRPQWAKAKTASTMTPDDSLDDSLAALQREALFIRRSALQNMKEIGKGQFGVVYGASFVRSNGARCKVAVKTIKRYDSPKEREEFLKEMTIMSKLVHPNIVRLYGLVEQESPWIVLELLPLGDLKSFLTKNKKPVDTLIKYMLDVAMGMHYIAEKGLIHRDLAARNIVLGEKQQCKVSDFGLLRELPPGDEIYVSQDKNSKWPIRWLAPESLRHRQFSSASDIWSFGVVLWEMYFPTKLPYEEMHDNMQCALQVCDGYRLTVPKEYPPMIARIMKACWLGIPEKRPSFLLISSLLTNMTFGE